MKVAIIAIFVSFKFFKNITDFLAINFKMIRNDAKKFLNLFRFNLHFQNKLFR